jgi:3-isopropylmalate dehydratase small subunit
MPEMETVIRNAVLTLGDNIDTDQIYPGRYLSLVDPKEIGSHSLEGVRPNIAAYFPRGGIVVAGRNFGCGSSREHAPIALMNMGASLVLAESFARIFFRNAINLGLPLMVCKGLAERVKDCDIVTADITGGTVTLADGAVLPCEAVSSHAMSILEAGGIKPLMRKRKA